MKLTQKHIDHLNEQLNECICNTVCFGEYKLKGSDNDYLVVYIRPFKKGIFVSGNFEKPTFFSGDVQVYDTGFYLRYDPYFEDLHHYLEQISDEILEGYLLPNDLYTGE